MKYKTGDRVQVGRHAGVITHAAPFGPINPQPQYTVQFDDGKKGVYSESEVRSAGHDNAHAIKE